MPKQEGIRKYIIKLTKTINLDSCYLFTGLIEEDAMNNITDILQAISIGLVVATFLLNTGRGLKAIDVCKECFIFLNNGVVKTEAEHFYL